VTHLRCGEIFSDDIITNFLLILTVKKFENWSIFDECVQRSVQNFWATLYCVEATRSECLSVALIPVVRRNGEGRYAQLFPFFLSVGFSGDFVSSILQRCAKSTFLIQQQFISTRCVKSLWSSFSNAKIFFV